MPGAPYRRRGFAPFVPGPAPAAPSSILLPQRRRVEIFDAFAEELRPRRRASLAPFNPVPFGVAGNWALSFREEFDAPTINPSKWVRGGDAGGGTDPTTGLIYTADDGLIFDFAGGGPGWLPEVANLSISSSIISMAVTPGSPVRGSGLATKNKFSFGYGYYEVYARCPTGVGGWPAVWLYSYTNDGVNSAAVGGTEMDIMESEGWVGSASNLGQNTHWNGYGVNHTEDPTGVLVSDGNWHYWGLNWQSGFYDYYLDGALTKHFTTAIGNPALIAAPGQVMILNNAYAAGATTGVCYYDHVRYWTGS